MCARTPNNRPARTDKRGIDACLAPFVRLLNQKGVETIFSCCGHGAERPTVTISGETIGALMWSDARRWIHATLYLLNEDTWIVEFDAVVCTPPRISPYLNLTRKQIREQRKAFGFRRP